MYLNYFLYNTFSILRFSFFTVSPSLSFSTAQTSSISFPQINSLRLFFFLFFFFVVRYHLSQSIIISLLYPTFLFRFSARLSFRLAPCWLYTNWFWQFYGILPSVVNRRCMCVCEWQAFWRVIGINPLRSVPFLFQPLWRHEKRNGALRRAMNAHLSPQHTEKHRCSSSVREERNENATHFGEISVKQKLPSEEWSCDFFFLYLPVSSFSLSVGLAYLGIRSCR